MTDSLFDMENLNCLNCGRPLTGGDCDWCSAPYKSQEAAEQIARRRDTAIDVVDAHANTEWKVKAYTIGEQIARDNDTLISEDIWDALVQQGFTTHEPRAMGAVMWKLNSRNVIEATDRFITSPSPLGHGRPTRVWRSRIFTGELGTLESDDRNSTTDPVPTSPPDPSCPDCGDKLVTNLYDFSKYGCLRCGWSG